jgi:hypothetical protein
MAPLVQQNDELYRRLGFTPEARELIAIEPGFPSLVPITRLDGVYVGERIQYVEVNADGPANGTNTDLLEDLSLSTFPMRELSASWPFVRRSRTRGMLTAILGCYRAYGGAATAPRIGIVGLGDSPYIPERTHAAKAWTEQGLPTTVLDARALSYDGGKLSAGGARIDIVSRRVPLRDFLRRPAELAPLLRAYRDGAVCMVTPLRSEIATNKGLIALLHEEQLKKVLTAEERALVDELIPYTCFADARVRADLLAEPVAWVLKPADGFGGDRVTMGSTVSSDDWQKHVDTAIHSPAPWVAQRVAPVSKVEVLDWGDGELLRRQLFVNWNPHIQGGQYSGASVRGSAEICINVSRGGTTLIPLELADLP